MDTLVNAEDRLPLTCTRAGTCCHGKAIFLNPWELARLAHVKGCTAREFWERETTNGGVRLRMGGNPAATCSQYDPARGCSVYAGRPLACRLFPLGRQRRGEQVGYLHRGEAFPCLAACPEVTGLPSLTVGDFLRGQEVAAGEAAQDAYLQVTLELGEVALVLLLEGSLSAAGDRQTLPRWRALGQLSDADLAATLPRDWLELLAVPGLEATEDPAPFVERHFALLQEHDAARPAPTTPATLRDRCCLAMASALHLGRSNGIDAGALVEHWISVARSHGARE